MSAFRIHLRPLLGWASVIALLTFPLFSVSGAFDMFLKISGPVIEGESKDKVHTDAIDVLAWSWGMSNSGTAISGAGKANVQDFSFTKYLDSSTPALMLAALRGDSFDEALFIVRQNNAKSPYEQLKLTLENVLVTSVSAGGSGGQDKLTENVTLNFSKFKLEYIPLKADGNTDAAKDLKWDISAGKSD